MNFSQYSDFRTCFPFPWVPFPNFSISRLCGFAYHYWKLSSMVGLSNERDKKLIKVSTSAWHLGKKFSKVTLCIRRHERNGEISWSLIGHKKKMPQNLCSIRSKNANGHLNWSVKGILPGAVPARLVNYRSHQASARTNFARFICLSPRLSAPGSPRMCASFPPKMYDQEQNTATGRTTREKKTNKKKKSRFHSLSVQIWRFGDSEQPVSCEVFWPFRVKCLWHSGLIRS